MKIIHIYIYIYMCLYICFSVLVCYRLSLCIFFMILPCFFDYCLRSNIAGSCLHVLHFSHCGQLSTMCPGHFARFGWELPGWVHSRVAIPPLLNSTWCSADVPRISYHAYRHLHGWYFYVVLIGVRRDCVAFGKLALRVFPAVTWLTLYRWLQINNSFPCSVLHFQL